MEHIASSEELFSYDKNLEFIFCMEKTKKIKFLQPFKFIVCIDLNYLNLFKFTKTTFTQRTLLALKLNLYKNV